MKYLVSKDYIHSMLLLIKVTKKKKKVLEFMDSYTKQIVYKFPYTYIGRERDRRSYSENTKNSRESESVARVSC